MPDRPPEDDPVVQTFEQVKDENPEPLSAHDMRILEFIRHYLVCYSARGAAMAMGIPKERAGTVGHRYFHHKKTQRWLREIRRSFEKDTEILRDEVVTMLVREANHDDGSPGAHGARVNALRTLAKILGMEQINLNQKVEDTTGQGRLVVPVAGTPEEWMALAQASQASLLEGGDPPPEDETNDDPDDVL